MRYAINLNPVLPIRLEPSERSEMVTQLLFGDFCIITEEKEPFVKIINYHDSYIGWADKKMLSEISYKQYLQLQQQPIFKTIVPIADMFCLTDKSIYKLSAGSSLPFFDYEQNSFAICNKKFQIHPSFVTHIPQPNKENIGGIAKLFFNAPYLWGGKNIFGIDCSGFTQTVFSICGYSISRDAFMQAQEGIMINTLDKAEPSDLLFFEKNKKITHVGILLENNQIIHASGKVRIDTIDDKGIYNKETKQYTHQLYSIKRLD